MQSHRARGQSTEPTSYCFATWTADPPTRYRNNIFHQAELVYPILSTALHVGVPPAEIYWRFPLLPWSRAMLELMARAPWRSARHRPPKIIVGNHSADGLVAACLRAGPAKGPGQYFVKQWKSSLSPPEATLRIRSAVLQACGITPRAAAAYPPRTAVYMPRRAGPDAQLQSGTRRNFAGWRDLVKAIETALPSVPPVAVHGTPSGNDPICRQVRVWADVHCMQHAHAHAPLPPAARCASGPTPTSSSRPTARTSSTRP